MHLRTIHLGQGGGGICSPAFVSYCQVLCTLCLYKHEHWEGPHRLYTLHSEKPQDKKQEKYYCECSEQNPSDCICPKLVKLAELITVEQEEACARGFGVEYRRGSFWGLIAPSNFILHSIFLIDREVHDIQQEENNRQPQIWSMTYLSKLKANCSWINIS